SPRPGVTPAGLRAERQPPRQSVTLNEELVGGQVASITGEEPAATKVNTFMGKDSTHWRRGVPTYQQVSLGEVYEGVEMRLAVRSGRVEKVFSLRGGAEPAQVRLRMRGGAAVEVTEQGGAGVG